jgi:hypothetical protein
MRQTRRPGISSSNRMKQDQQKADDHLLLVSVLFTNLFMIITQNQAIGSMS